MNHIQRYSLAYLQAVIFIIIQIAITFSSAVESLSPEQLAALHGFKLWGFLFGIIGTSGTTILAFLNQSVTKAQAVQDTAIQTQPTAPKASS